MTLGSSSITSPSHLKEQTWLNLCRLDFPLMETLIRSVLDLRSSIPAAGTAIATSRGQGAAHCEIKTWGSHWLVESRLLEMEIWEMETGDGELGDGRWEMEPV